MRGRAQRVDTRGTRQGLTVAEQDLVIARQGGVCLICGRVPTGSWSVDHDHELARGHPHEEWTGCRRCLRGMLCGACNSMLGFARDDPATLRRAADYVELSRSRR